METISVITNKKVSGEIVYGMLKSRTDIEQSYDTFKNTFHADRTYMGDDHQLQGWMFINFIALMLHYRIYGLLGKYSPQNVIEHFARVFVLKIWDEWKISEIPKKSKVLIDSLEIPIMQNSWSQRLKRDFLIKDLLDNTLLKQHFYRPNNKRDSRAVNPLIST
jgi:hypothetical protein